MAKAKKKEITIEEALVPAEEQPYEVPENWCWTKVRYVSEVVTGSTPSKKHEEYYGGSFPFFKPADLDAGDNVVDATEYLSDEGKAVSRIVPRLSTAVCCIGTIGKSGLLKVEGTTNQQINSMIPRINPLYVYYYSKTNEFVRELWDKSTSTTISMVNKSNLETNNIPLPPLPEQQRIVEQIESLFYRLDEAKEKAQEALESFEIRKKSIIHKAFTGKLTAEWRNKNGVSLDTWGKMVLGDVCESIYDGDHMPPPKSENGIPFLVISNVNDGYLSFDNTRFVPEDYYNSLSDSRKPKKGDVLYTLVGSYGIPVVVDTDKAFCFQRHMGLLKPQLVDTYFLWYQLQSDVVYEKATAIATGTAQLTVPIRGLRKIEIAVPTMDEQKEIVRILDEIFTKEEKQKKNTARVIEQINVLKKSVLSKAFRGKLGTNDPSEESAEELLTSILQQS